VAPQSSITHYATADWQRLFYRIFIGLYTMWHLSAFTAKKREVKFLGKK